VRPLFQVVEVAFALGLTCALQRAVETRVCPTHNGEPRARAA